MTANISSETREAGKKRNNTFQGPKEKNYHLRNLYPTKISFREEREIKTL